MNSKSGGFVLYTIYLRVNRIGHGKWMEIVRALNTQRTGVQVREQWNLMKYNTKRGPTNYASRRRKKKEKIIAPKIIEKELQNKKRWRKKRLKNDTEFIKTKEINKKSKSKK